MFYSRWLFFKAAVPDGSSGFHIKSLHPGTLPNANRAKGEQAAAPHGAEDEFGRWNAHATALRVHSTEQMLCIDHPGAISQTPGFKKNDHFF